MVTKHKAGTIFSSCGQTCVAMILHKEPAEIHQQLVECRNEWKGGGTTEDDVIWLLEKNGCFVASLWRRMFTMNGSMEHGMNWWDYRRFDSDNPHLLLVRTNPGTFHWIVAHYRHIYDPNEIGEKPLEDFAEKYPTWRIRRVFLVVRPDVLKSPD